MKPIKQFKKWGVFTLILFGLNVGIFNTAMSEIAHISVGDYPPYIDFSSKNKGFMSEIVLKAFNEVGVKSVFKQVPWKRVEDVDIPKGKLSFSYVKSAAREQKFLFSDEIMTAPTMFIVKKSLKFSWKKVEDLIPYSIGISRGYWYGKEFDAMKSKLKIQIVNSDLINIKKVLKERIDLFPVDPYVGTQLLKKNFTSEEREKLEFVMKPSLSTDPMYVVCSKKSSKCGHLIEQFNKGLKTLRKKGEVKKIIERALNVN